MTYYEILKSGYEFLMHEEIEEDIAQEAFCRPNIKDEVLQKEIKMLYVYLELYLLNNKGLLSETKKSLLSFLERKLVTYEISMSKKFEKADKRTKKSMQDSLTEIEGYLSDTIDDLDYETKRMIQDSIADEYLSEFTKNLINTDPEIEIVESAFDKMLETIIPSLHHLFFSIEGYKYIPSEFHIADEKLRKECFDYYKNLTYDFYMYNIEYGKEQPYWLTMIKVLEIMLLLIAENNYPKLKRFMKIDNSILYEANDCLINSLLPTPTDIKIDLETKAFERTTVPECLNLFLDDNTIFSEFSPYQISIIIIGYFRQVRNKDKAMNNLLSKLTQIKEIFASPDSESLKRKRIYKSSWQEYKT